MSTRKLSNIDFINKSNIAHIYKYDYSESNYINSQTKIKIICNDHGSFWQIPSAHFRGAGCLKCAILFKAKKLSLTTDQFIEKANKIHDNKYDYSKSNYINGKTDILIICKDHGDFWANPHNHISSKAGCYQCGRISSSKKQIFTTEYFINKANECHLYEYDYSKSIYTSIDDKIEIICNNHGSFWQIAYNHLTGQGCPICGTQKSAINRTSNIEYFIIKAKEIYGDKYDYSKSIYIKSNSKIEIICKKNNHGSFWQTPNNHLIDTGCPICGYETVSKKLKSNIKDFIEKANAIHNFKYNYSLSEYVSAIKKIKIICNIHGIFDQISNDHLNGHGCSKCAKVISYKEINWLKSLNINTLIAQHRIILDGKLYKVDAYDPITNTIYEFYGDFWHGNPEIFDSIKINSVSKKPFGELYRKTIEKEASLKHYGYNLVAMWEKDWDLINKNNILPLEMPYG